MTKATLLAKGTTDLYGEALQFRLWVLNVIRDTFETFGFEPLETPIIERIETLTGKYGEEAQNLIFWVPDYKVGMRYDHTVPLARFVASNQGTIPMPFRRYAVGPVFRGENTQAGRNRQFTQCDFDTVGSSAATIDAEIVALNYKILTSLGFTTQFSVNINDRRLLNAMVTEMGFTNEDQATIVMTAWDKLDKMTPDDVFANYLVKQFSKFSVSEDQLKQSYVPVTKLLFDLKGQTPEKIISGINGYFKSKEVHEATEKILNLINVIRAMNVPENAFEFNPLLARGLSYYTGPIFETIVKEAGIGSITGGGRYDNLIENLGGPSIPASGSSFGLERILSVMEKLNIRPALTNTVKVFVTVFDTDNQELVSTSFKVATILRDAHISTEVYSGEGAKVGKQIALADKKSIPLVIVIGLDELKTEVVKLKNLKTREETTVPVKDLLQVVQGLLLV